MIGKKSKNPISEIFIPGKKFTLIELLVVIAIIAILAAILLPALSRAKQAAKQTVCIGNIKTITFGMQLYTDNYNGYFAARDTNIAGDTYRFWYRKIYTEVNGLNWGPGDPSLLKSFDFLRCPSHIIPSNKAIDWPTIAYGRNDSLGIATSVRIDKVKRPSQVIMLGDSDDDGYYGMILAADLYALGNRHQRNASVSFVDGHAEKVYSKTYILPDVVYGEMTDSGVEIRRTTASAIVPVTSRAQFYKDTWGFRGGGYDYLTQ